VFQCYKHIPLSYKGWLVGWLGFNGTFSTNRSHRATKKIKVCWRCLSL